MKFPKTWRANRPKDFEALRKERQKYPDVVVKLLETSDVIIEVLDARFPEETRNREIEGVIKKAGKRLIFALNKSDLINKEKFIVPKDMKPFVFISCKDRAGSRTLRDLIKREVRYKNDKFDRAQVGVIGYPNTGKSSLINFLIGRSSAKTAYEAGFTKGLQKLKLSSKILLMDTPGVIPKDKYSHHDQLKISHHVMVGARNYDKVKNPEFIVAEIMKIYPTQIARYYSFDFEGDVEILLEKLGKQRNFMSKGGKVDEDRTARSVLRDWQEGRIISQL
jgi:ribosome biogenesis GTPase A